MLDLQGNLHPYRQSILLVGGSILCVAALSGITSLLVLPLVGFLGQPSSASQQNPFTAIPLPNIPARFVVEAVHLELCRIPNELEGAEDHAATIIVQGRHSQAEGYKLDGTALKLFRARIRTDEAGNLQASVKYLGGKI